MDRIMAIWDKIAEKPVLFEAIKGVAMGIALILLYLFLLHSDFSTAPEFIYSQF